MTKLVSKDEKRMFYMVRFKSTTSTYYATVESPAPHLVIGMACEQLASEYSKQPLDFLGLVPRIVETSSYTPKDLPTITMKGVKASGIDNAPRLVKSCIEREHEPYYPPRVPMFKSGDGEAELCCVNAIQVQEYVNDGYKVVGGIKNASIPVKRILHKGRGM